MGEFVYLKNSYKKHLDTKVVSCEKKGDHWEITLVATIFYPEGGGQPSDKGTITGKSGHAKVKHVRLKGDVVIHEAVIEGTLVPGDTVACDIDWNLRYHNMRVHSAGHIVHEAVKQVDANLVPVKGEHGSQAYIEYEGSLTVDKKYSIEKEANAIVDSDVPLTTEFVSLEELTRRSPWVPTHLPKNKPLRILTVGNFSPIPDGGTQIAHSSEAGPITVTEIENADGHVRVHYQITNVEAPQETSPTSGTLTAAQLTGILLDAQKDALEMIRDSNLPPDQLKLAVLGGKSDFSEASRKITHVPTADRQAVGIVINQVKKTIEASLDQAATTKTQSSDKAWIDVTMPGIPPLQGHLHPTTIVIEEMNAIFQNMGFSIADGPEIETDEYNYNRLNLPLDHPARDLQDSLYIDEPNWLLRTHTSSVESHLLEEVKPPFRYVIPGKVYRHENANATNNIMFYQYEGMAVGTDITLAHLKGTLDLFVKKFFGEKRETRFRCKYYPQVEPGVGVDISCAFCNKKGCTVCKYRGWIEMLGAGMVHPNMFVKAGLDPAVYSGFAWGMGLDRIVMQRYGIADIRSLYNGDIGYKE